MKGNSPKKPEIPVKLTNTELKQAFTKFAHSIFAQFERDAAENDRKLAEIEKNLAANQTKPNDPPKP